MHKSSSFCIVTAFCSESKNLNKRYIPKTQKIKVVDSGLKQDFYRVRPFNQYLVVICLDRSSTVLHEKSKNAANAANAASLSRMFVYVP